MTVQSVSPTIVLAHAAWFDGSSWNKVIFELQQRGHRAIAAQLPLTSLTADVETVRRLVARQKGPVILAGHSYGGAVITAAGAGTDNVEALVYVSAIVPDQAETVGQIFGRTAPHPKAPALQPDADGFFWLDVDDFRNAVTPDTSREETAQLEAVQRPINVKCLDEPLGKAAWHEKPSWFLIAENDRMLSPDTQRFTAERMRSTVVSLPVDHVPLTSKPKAVVEIIEKALKSVEHSVSAHNQVA
jgi:pimeloyl-ACP methyl ester carboxylesterase